jgi:hypothetical protein
MRTEFIAQHNRGDRFPQKGSPYLPSVRFPLDGADFFEEALLATAGFSEASSASSGFNLTGLHGYTQDVRRTQEPEKQTIFFGEPFCRWMPCALSLPSHDAKRRKSNVDAY